MIRFIRRHPVKMFFHGFSDTPRTGWIRAVKASYFKVGNFNMFSVDWTSMVIPPWYSIAAANSKYG